MTWLSVLAEPWFVLSWYAIGAIGVCFLIHDLHNHNPVLKPAMKWAWPIIVFFFSAVGLALYFLTARAPGIGRVQDEPEKQRIHDQYEMNMWRRVNGAVIHCVAGDGAGIMTAMVIARAAGMSFWQEFWFEYLVGFAFGWFIFQRKSMTMMTDSIPQQLAMAFRAEFFSMLTVMAGMGAVMAYVTPMVATQQPKPLTAAFWGFGMLGLLAGYVMTFPMNWLIVKVGWKHGMGSMADAKKMQFTSSAYRRAAIAAMIVFGLGSEILPAWLLFLRQSAALRNGTASVTASDIANTGAALELGLRASLGEAVTALRAGRQTQASVAIDRAFRASQVGAHSAPGAFYAAYEQIVDAKLAIEQGHHQAAEQHLQQASQSITAPTDVHPPFLDPRGYRGATVIDPSGGVIGEVIDTDGDALDLVIGGWRNAWGLVDFGGGRQITVDASALAYSAPRRVGPVMVALPALPIQRAASR